MDGAQITLEINPTLNHPTVVENTKRSQKTLFYIEITILQHYQELVLEFFKNKYMNLTFKSWLWKEINIKKKLFYFNMLLMIIKFRGKKIVLYCTTLKPQVRVRVRVRCKEKIQVRVLVRVRPKVKFGVRVRVRPSMKVCGNPTNRIVSKIW